MANRRRLFWVPSVLIALLIALPGSALARPELGPPIGVLYTVTSLADGGSTPGECTLREAITSANGGATDCGLASGAAADEIEFSVAGTITLNSALPPVNGDLTIGGANLIAIDGVSTYPILTVNGGKTLMLSDLVFYRGHSASEGGAIHNSGTLYVTHGTFISNTADTGGGAIYSFGIAEIHQSEFLSNTATIGGAILNPGIMLLEDGTFGANESDHSSRGGAVWSSGPLTILGGQFDRNKAGAGGAIYARREVDSTSLTVSGAVFDDNRALAGYPDGKGGAVLIDNLAVIIQASLFSGNNGQSGGAIHVSAAGVLTLTNSTLRNSSFETTSGGGLYNQGAAYLNGVTLSTNKASHGGGIDNFGLLFLTNVTLSQNQADYGGGLKNEDGTARLSNVTVWGNTASNGQAGGILSSGPTTHLNLTNVIIADSPRGGNCLFAPAPDLSDFNLSSDDTCDFGVGRNNLNLKLGPLANNGGATQTHLPRLDSPAIGGGTDDNAPSVDQRGYLRPQGTFFDVGSVEVRPGEARQYIYVPLMRR